MNLRLRFIQFPLTLTLNNASTSLGGGYYLGTSNWKNLRIRWNIFKKTCLVFQSKGKKKKGIGFYDYFSFR